MQFSGITSGAKSDGLSGGSLPTGVCVCVCVCVHVCVRVYVCVYVTCELYRTCIFRITPFITMYTVQDVICCMYVHVYALCTLSPSTHADIEEGLVEPPAKKSKPSIL